MRIETHPAGVTVLVAGQSRGVTPMELELDRGDHAVELSFEKEGFAGLTQVVVPNVDQLLRVSIDEEAAAPTTVESTPKKKKKKKKDKSSADESPYTRFN